MASDDYTATCLRCRQKTGVPERHEIYCSMEGALMKVTKVKNYINFRAIRPQYYHDFYRKVTRVCRFQGKCITCNKRTYGFDDGEDDPRGPLGNNANCTHQAIDYGMTGKDIVQCFNCANEESSYTAAINLAKHKYWRK